MLAIAVFCEAATANQQLDGRTGTMFSVVANPVVSEINRQRKIDERCLIAAIRLWRRQEVAPPDLPLDN